MLIEVYVSVYNMYSHDGSQMSKGSLRKVKYFVSIAKVSRRGALILCKSSILGLL